MKYRSIERFLATVAIAAALHCLCRLEARAAWEEGGNPVCTSEGDQYYPYIIPDGLGSSFVVWQEMGTGGGDVFLQKVDEAGMPVWTIDGLAACPVESPRAFFRQAVPDGAGGLIIVWSDYRTGSVDIYAQRIGAGGQAEWEVSGILLSAPDADDLYPAVVPDGAGGIIAAWQHGHDPAGTVFVQRLGSSGEPAWAAEGVRVASGDGQSRPVISADGAGGAFVTWTDAASSLVMAQRLGPSGELLWMADGVSLAAQSSAEGFPSVQADGDGGMMVLWEDVRSGDTDIYAQRTGSGGELLWGAGGLEVAAGEGDQWLPVIATDGAGGVIAAWVDGSGGDRDIRAQRLGVSGAPGWTPGGVSVCSLEGDQLNPRIAACGGGACIIVWQDGRSADLDIYAQKLDAGGSVLWEQDGIPVAGGAGDQRLPEIYGDAAGGAVVVWEDWADGPDVYSKHIGSDGQRLATMLAGFDCRSTEEGIGLEWTISVDADAFDFSVYRSESGSGIFERLPGEVLRWGEAGFVYSDQSASPGTDYLYRVTLTRDGVEEMLFTAGPLSLPPSGTKVSQNWPNPFNPVTNISYFLAERSYAELTVFDASGRRIRVLARGVEDRGEHRVVWDGLDSRGDPAGSGVYFYRLRAGKETQTKKMILMR